MKAQFVVAILAIIYGCLALGAFIVDAVNERWGWVVAELVTGSALAGIRGLYLILHSLFGA